MYWSAPTGTHVLKNIRHDYRKLGGETSYLGYPITDELPTSDGRGSACHFQKGSAYYTPSGNTYFIQNGFRDTWFAMGAETSTFGYPISNEIPGGNNGCYQKFQNGNMFWSPATGVHLVTNPVYDKYMAKGGTNVLGYPISAKSVSTEGITYQSFQKATIYCNSSNAYIMIANDEVTNKWNSLGGLNSALGYPTSELGIMKEDKGKYQDFQCGTIYVPNYTGTAIAVMNEIREKYKAIGAESSYLGYPTSDQKSIPGTTWIMSEFENGVIIHNPVNGAFDMPWSVFNSQWYKNEKGRGGLGRPLAGLEDMGSGLYEQRFQYGKVQFRYENGKLTAYLTELNLDVPEYNQLGYSISNMCWSTCASMAISYFNKDTINRNVQIAIDKVRNIPFLNASSGGFPSDIAHYVTKYTGRNAGVIVGPGPLNYMLRNINTLAYAFIGPAYAFWDMTDNEIAKQAPCVDRSFTYEEIANEIALGRPVVANWCSTIKEGFSDGHFVLIKGFKRSIDGTTMQSINYIDPAGAVNSNMGYEDFKKPDHRYLCDIVLFK